MSKTKISQLWNYQLVRFGVVGCFNTLFDISLLFLFVKLWGVPEIIANTLSVLIAVSVSYFLNHRVVFQYHEKYTLKNYVRFLLITGLSITVVQNIVIYLFTEVLWIAPIGRTVLILNHSVALRTITLLVAKLLAVGVGMGWNYFLYKYIIFRHKEPVDKSDEIVIA